jgi:mannose-6-phosphate isomerase-like protein (cupin superfamily)
MAASTELITASLDGKVAGGLEIMQPRDELKSVVLIMKHGIAATTGLHWHEEKTEYLQILQGRAKVRLGNETAVFTSDDGPITVPRFLIHEYGRADGGAIESTDPDLRVKEWVSPPDGTKEIFFRNIIGTLNDRQETSWGNVKTLLAIFTLMNEHDNYPVFVSGPVWLRKRVTYAVLTSVAFIGRLCGFKAVNEKYAARS